MYGFALRTPNTNEAQRPVHIPFWKTKLSLAIAAGVAIVSGFLTFTITIMLQQRANDAWVISATEARLAGVEFLTPNPTHYWTGQQTATTIITFVVIAALLLMLLYAIKEIRHRRAAQGWGGIAEAARQAKSSQLAF